MSQSTKERLLSAANKVFAEHGYEAATVQMIAAEAEANIAAVNYHFGSKSDLYAAHIRVHLEHEMSGMPKLSDVPDDPEGQLRKFVEWFFKRYLPESPLHRLNQDISSMKSDFTATILENVIRPEFENCRELVTAILPEGTGEETIRCWIKSIISLCTGPIHGAHLYPELFPGIEVNQQEIELHAKHVADMIIGNLTAVATG